MNIQKGSYAYVHHNDIRGPWAVGPLNKADGLNDTGARFKYAIFENNHAHGEQLVIEHGSEHVSIRSNLIEQKQGIAIDIDGYSYTYGRGVVDLNIVNNTIVNKQATGRAIFAGSGQQDMTVANNLYVAPNMVTGPYLTSVMWVAANNLNAFDEISNNVWADADVDPWAGGLMYLGTGTDASGFYDANEWRALPQVNNDRFSDVQIDGSYRPTNSNLVNVGKAEAGIFKDYYGNWYDYDSGRTVGAVTL